MNPIFQSSFHIRMTACMSLDGIIASDSLETNSQREKLGYHSKDDYEILKKDIEWADLIIIGAKSLFIEKGAISVTEKKHWLVLSSDPEKTIQNGHYFWKQKSLYPHILKYKNKEDLYERILTFDQGIKNILVLGGGFIYQLFWEDFNIQSLRLTICPGIRGKGISFFPLQKSFDSLILRECHLLSHGFCSFLYGFPDPV